MENQLSRENMRVRAIRVLLRVPLKKSQKMPFYWHLLVLYPGYISKNFSQHFQIQKMDKLLSSSCNVKCVPKDYTFPPETRPGNFTFTISNSTPIIDLGGLDRATAVQQILKASQDFGYFQVINHGIDEELIKTTMSVWKSFFEMPAEDKAAVYSDDPTRSCRLCSITLSYAEEKITLWRENLRHYCHPLHKRLQEWPQKPDVYREVVGKYVEEVTRLGSRILELICDGLGLQSGYFNGKMSENTFLSANYYPKCPEPGLTFGFPAHCDSSLITLLVQDHVGGLQFSEDGKWAGVGPVPNSFVVNLGYALQIISNNNLRSAEHRAVTNREEARISAAFFISPSNDTIVEPAKALLNSGKPPLYRSFEFKEFLVNFLANNFDPRLALEPFELQS